MHNITNWIGEIMKLIEDIKSIARKEIKTIVLPEVEDERD